MAQGAPATGRADRPMAIAFPQFEGRESLVAKMGPLTEPWMFDAWWAVRHDAALGAASRRADRAPADIVSAGVGTVEGVERLLLVTTEPAHRLTSAALIAAALSAAADAPSAAELSPDRRAAAELRTWERPAADVAPSGSSNQTGTSDGRWLWVAALVLLLVEWRMRRPRPVTATAEASHAARVA